LNYSEWMNRAAISVDGVRSHRASSSSVRKWRS